MRLCSLHIWASVRAVRLKLPARKFKIRSSTAPDHAPRCGRYIKCCNHFIMPHAAKIACCKIAYWDTGHPKSGVPQQLVP